MTHHYLPLLFIKMVDEKTTEILIRIVKFLEMNQRQLDLLEKRIKLSEEAMDSLVNILGEEK